MSVMLVFALEAEWQNMSKQCEFPSQSGYRKSYYMVLRLSSKEIISLCNYCDHTYSLYTTTSTGPLSSFKTLLDQACNGFKQMS